MSQAQKMVMVSLATARLAQEELLYAERALRSYRFVSDVEEGALEKHEAVRVACVELASAPAAPRDMYADVLEFHAKLGCAIGTIPADPGEELRALRFRLMEEELEETADAMEAGNLAEVADGLADLIYVALGTAITYGIDLGRVWEEVHRSNMEKLGGEVRPDGKILKPEGWTPPDITGVLERQPAITALAGAL